MKYKVIDNKLVKYMDIKCIHIVTEELIEDETTQSEHDTNIFYEDTRSIRMTNWLSDNNLTIHDQSTFKRYHEMFCIDYKDSLDDTYISSFRHCRICLHISCDVHR